MIRLSLIPGYLLSSATSSSNDMVPFLSWSASSNRALVRSFRCSSLKFIELSSMHERMTVFSSSKSILPLPARSKRKTNTEHWLSRLWRAWRKMQTIRKGHFVRLTICIVDIEKKLQLFMLSAFGHFLKSSHDLLQVQCPPFVRVEQLKESFGKECLQKSAVSRESTHKFGFETYSIESRVGCGCASLRFEGLSLWCLLHLPWPEIRQWILEVWHDFCHSLSPSSVCPLFAATNVPRQLCATCRAWVITCRNQIVRASSKHTVPHTADGFTIKNLDFVQCSRLFHPSRDRCLGTKFTFLVFFFCDAGPGGEHGWPECSSLKTLSFDDRQAILFAKFSKCKMIWTRWWSLRFLTHFGM